MKMDKKEFTNILQVSLFSFDGLGEEEIRKFKFTEREMKTGIELCKFLKEK